MMPRRNSARASSAFLVLLVFLVIAAECSSASWVSRLSSFHKNTCSRRCVVEQCHTIGIKYGKYCGLGYTGCPGEKPCDDLDACCMKHDDCVGKFGMTHVKCHEKLKKCLKRAQKSGKVGFSKKCPYNTAAATMIRGMDVAITLSQLGQTTLDFVTQ